MQTYWTGHGEGFARETDAGDRRIEKRRYRSMLIMNFQNTLLALFLSMVFALPALSVAVDKPLGDPMLEAQARAIHKQLRCLVCQNQSIEDSNASLARDLRILVRDRISAGDGDEAVIRFVVDRYGDWVLLQPPLKSGTIALWTAPAIFLAISILLIVLWYRRRRDIVAISGDLLSNEEQDRLKSMMKNRDSA